MPSFLRRLVFSILPSPALYPGSFTLEQIQRIDYTEPESAAITPTPVAPSEQQPLAEGKGEDVAIPMVSMEVGEQVTTTAVAQHVPSTLEGQQSENVSNETIEAQIPLTSSVPEVSSVDNSQPEETKALDPAPIYIPLSPASERREPKPIARKTDLPATVPDYIPAEVFLEISGFFTPSSKRLKSIFVKEKILGEKVLPDGTKRKLKTIIRANASFGLPITSDLDYYRAFQKICDESVDKNGRYRLPLLVPTKKLVRYAGRGISKITRTEARDWLKRMTFTGIEGGIYRAKSGDFQDGFVGTVFSQVVIKGEQLRDGKIAETNYVWPAPWFLSNYFHRHLRPVDFSFHRRLRKPIAKALTTLLDTGWYASQGKPYSKSYHITCNEFLLREYHHLSDIKRQLDPAHQELHREGFLDNWEYRKSVDGQDWIITYWPGLKWVDDQKARTERRQLAEQIPTKKENGENTRAKQPALPFFPSAEAEETSQAAAAMRTLIVDDILSVTSDPHSKDYYRLLARKVPEQILRTALSETKDADRRNAINTNPGRYFTSTVKRLASAQGITL